MDINPPARRTKPVIAIDGPAGAGKSTVAAHLARIFGYLNLETGAMYRALSLKAIERDIDLDSEAELIALASTTRIRLEPQRDGNRVLLDGVNITRRARDGDVTAAASRVSVHPQVRQWMVEQQRAMGAAGGVVMEGRDIGTVVFPDAEVKIFLDADAEVRGSRRFQQVSATPVSDGTGSKPPAEGEILRDLKERDARDRSRAESPLRAADDAITIDSTGLTLEQVLAKAEEVVRAHLSGNLGDVTKQ